MITGGGATPPSRRSRRTRLTGSLKNVSGHEIIKGFGGIRWKKILRYYGTKAVRSNRKVGRLYQADRKVNRRVSKPDLQVTKRIDTTPEINYNSNIMNYKSNNKIVSEAHRNRKPHFIHLTHSTHAKRAAFTLAEVLITLAIIGIVAAMTIPTLISNYQKKALKTQFTQTYSLISQAVGLMKANLPFSSIYSYYTAYDPENSFYRANEFRSDFPKYIKLLKNYVSPSKMPTYYTYDGSREYSSDGNYAIYKPDLVLANGAYLRISISGSLDGILMAFAVDINGAKGPNKAGHDYFIFQIMNSKDVLEGKKMTHLYTEDEWKDSPTAGLMGLPCSVKSTQSANGVGCAWYALKDVCPDDVTKGYWECLPR